MPTLGGGPYGEEPFRYFLAVERKRAQRSGCLLLLLLVDLEGPPGVSARIDRAIATRLFADLGRCLRETDFIGWYREERVAGAVLTELGDGPPREVARRVGQRVREALGGGLPSNVARRLRVHVYPHLEPEPIDSAMASTPS
jgi:hypothetical protein